MSKISELSDGGVIQGGDTLIAVRSGGNVKVTYGGTTTANIDGGTIDGTTIGGTTPAAGNFTTGSFTGNVSFGDNDKAIFGAGSDLQIYHDGSNSYVADVGTGNLLVQADNFVVLETTAGANYFQGQSGGASTIYYSGSPKLDTTSTGIDVTGNVVSDGLTVDGSSVLSATDSATNTVTTGLKVGHNTSGTTANGFGSALEFEAENSTYSAVNTHAKIESVVTDQISVHSDLNVYTKYNNSLQKRMSFNNDGDISFYEDTGTTAKLTWDSSAETLIVQGSDAGTAGIFVESSTAGVGARLDTIDATISNTASLTNSLLLDSDNHAIIRMDSNNNGSGDFYITESTSDTARLRIANNGDVSMFEDTGTTAKFYWDASAESLGIGTSSPSSALHVSDAVTHAASTEVALIQNTTTGQPVALAFQAVADNGGSGNEGAIYFDAGADGTVTNNQLQFTADHQSNTTPDMVITGAGNVGIGTDSPSRLLDIYDSAVSTYPVNAAQFGNNGGAQGAFQITGFSNTEWGFNALNSRNIVFHTNQTERMRILSTGGITFNGDTAQANALDDYEEGTWTPTIQGSGGGAYTYTGVTSRYTKIGNLVTLTANLTNITTSGTGHTGYLAILGAPFTKIADTFPVGAVGLSSVDFSSGTTYGTIEFITTSTSTTLYVRLHGDNVAGADLATGDINSGTSDITFSIQYIAA